MRIRIYKMGLLGLQEVERGRLLSGRFLIRDFSGLYAIVPLGKILYPEFVYRSVNVRWKAFCDMYA